MNRIRNFSIIAHIDHGKTSLSDRLIMETATVSGRDFKDLMLDSMDLERERGITIKSSPVAMEYRADDGNQYLLNLIDTPGHVDFSYEVSRALAGCEGALLVIDATQGVQAQTVANMYKAMELDLAILPVINKVDLPAANVEKTLRQARESLGLDPATAILCSAKTGQGVHDVLEAVVRHIPAPRGNPESVLRALIFDAEFDPFRGAVVHVRVVDGSIRPGDDVMVMSSGRVFTVEDTGVFKPKRVGRPVINAGEVGYFIAGIKTVGDTPIGDTVTAGASPAASPLPGFLDAKPVVFMSLYPIDTAQYEELGEALGKLRLNDASLHYQKESSVALGSGYRCGFLGLLHADISTERLTREYNLSLFATTPSVQYRITLKDGTVRLVDNPAHYPDPGTVQEAEEPYIDASMILPDEYLGNIMKLCMERRGVNLRHDYVGDRRVEVRVHLPLAEVIYDFYDHLKSLTQGYGSFDYEIIGFRPADLVKLEILVNGETVDALATLLHKDRAQSRAREICERLAEEIPRHQFKIPIQGALGGKIIARETVNPVRKDVTAKCYGGDVTRKRKLLEKQKEGKKKMKSFGKVSIPQKAFLAVLTRKGS